MQSPDSESKTKLVGVREGEGGFAVVVFGRYQFVTTKLKLDNCPFRRRSPFWASLL